MGSTNQAPARWHAGGATSDEHPPVTGGMIDIEPRAPRKLLVLDLDETLVHATGVGLDRAPDFQVGRYAVYRRPGLDPFLSSIREHFRLAVWTSSTRGYAEQVVAQVFGDPASLEFVWSRERCTPRFDPEQHDFEWAKNLGKLKRLGHRLEHVLMLDDTPAKLARHYGNLVRVKPFLGDLADRELFQLRDYLPTLKDVANVRQIEKRYWRRALPESPDGAHE